jgi:hypothetical protein
MAGDALDEGLASGGRAGLTLEREACGPMRKNLIVM